jgi:rifampicin phosphotransferase
MAADVSLAAVGGKALNLNKLAVAGFNVPNGFFVPTDTYWDYVNHNDLMPLIQGTLANLDPTNPTELSAAADKIRTQFVGGTRLPWLAASLEIAWPWLGARPVAVRSSATAEDLPDMSFAGQQDTFLNIIGVAALAEAIVKCWSSLWTARAIGYRARNGILHEEVAIGVIVQNMVASRAAGVLFTANPLTGKRTETVIDATLGLGEALVAGHVEPDHYVVAAASHAAGETFSANASHLPKMEIIHKSLGSKAVVMTGKSEGGINTQEQDSSQIQAISDEFILQLAEKGQDIQNRYNFPQDIEWARDENDNLHILQSRPITSLFPLPENLPLEPTRFMVGFHTVQGILEPLTPLGNDVMKLVLTGGAQVFGLDLTIQEQTAFFTAAERIWINTTPILRTPLGNKNYSKVIKSIDPGVAAAAQKITTDPRFAPIHKRPSLSTIRRVARFGLPFIGQILLTLRQPDIRRTEVLQIMDDIVAQMQKNLSSSGDLWRDFRNRISLLHEVKNLFPSYLIPRGVPPIVAGMMSFFGILERFAKEIAAATGEARYKTIHLEIARGITHNVTTEMDLILWQTAQVIQGDTAALHIFENTAGSDLATQYLTGALPPTAQIAVAQFLERYGARGLGEIDLGRIRWREDPTHVMQVLKSYLRINDPEFAPDVVFERGAIAAEQAVEDMVTAARNLPGGWLKARLVRFAAGRYWSLGGMREAPKFFAIRMLGVIREGLLQSGQELMTAGHLTAADDLFFLYIHEFDELWRGAGGAENWDEGARWEVVREKVAARRALRAKEMRRKQIPRVLLSDGTAFYEGVTASPEAGSGIVGDPVSPGVVEGTVRVVLNPHGTQLEPGEILVCPGTDPAWTPLFLAASGLVMEVGGMMTHGSVVAREYGIPAVVGVDKATTRLKTGNQIRVDGATGMIEMVEG